MPNLFQVAAMASSCQQGYSPFEINSTTMCIAPAPCNIPAAGGIIGSSGISSANTNSGYGASIGSSGISSANTNRGVNIFNNTGAAAAGGFSDSAYSSSTQNNRCLPCPFGGVGSTLTVQGVTTNMCVRPLGQ